MKTIFEIGRSVHAPKNRQWFWHAKRKGRIVADGGEGYSSKSMLLKSLKSFLKSIRNDEFTITD